MIKERSTKEIFRGDSDPEKEVFYISESRNTITYNLISDKNALSGTDPTDEIFVEYDNR